MFYGFAQRKIRNTLCPNLCHICFGLAKLHFSQANGKIFFLAFAAERLISTIKNNKSDGYFVPVSLNAFFCIITKTLLFSRLVRWRWPDKRAERFGLSLIFCFFCIKAKEKAKTESKTGNNGVFHFQRKVIQARK